MQTLLKALRTELRAQINLEAQLASKKFFKEAINVYGLTVPAVTKIAKAHLPDVFEFSKSEVLNLCEELWKSGMMEESFLACDFAYSLRAKYELSDFDVFERWIRNYVSNWASCDTLCNHTVGELVMQYPECVQRLLDFTSSDNRWVKRAAAVTLIIPARKGLFQQELFQIADRLLLDSDDLVQKGYGWMLKAASQFDPQAVFDFVIARKDLMPRTAYRYAIEKMAPELRKEAMAK
jgi:3-methyladenine DNA glycosylase AlkD